MGRLGQKTGSGYYNYDPETRARSTDEAVIELVEAKANEFGIARRAISDEEIVDRLVFALVNEGARILEEGIAQRSGDIDIVYIYGYGFPPVKGGPMHYADAQGLARVYERICEFREQLDAGHWQPATLLKDLAENGSSFEEWSRS